MCVFVCLPCCCTIVQLHPVKLSDANNTLFVRDVVQPECEAWVRCLPSHVEGNVEAERSGDDAVSTTAAATLPPS